MLKFIRNNYKRFLAVSLALIMVILLSGNAAILEVLGQEWQKIFQESRQWQIAADAAFPSELRPVDPDGTLTNVVFSTGVVAWSLIDDDPDSADTADYIQEAEGDITTIAFLNITDMPADFDAMETLYVKIYLDIGGVWADDTSVLYAQMYKSDESATLTSEMQLAANGTGSGVINIQFTGVDTTSSYKTTWNAARLRLRWVRTQNKGPDTAHLTVAATELSGTYAVSAAQPPTINEVNVYGTGVTEVTITEDSAFDIMASAYIDDPDGCTSVRDEGGVEAIFYTADQYWTPGQTGTCSLDYNNCIDNSVTSCSYQACNGNIATYECWASSSWYYYADATIGSTASVSGGWEVVVWASDSLSTVESSSCDDFAPTASNQAEVTLVSAIALETGSQSVAYDNNTDDSDSAIKERGIRNSGNRGINPQIQQTTALTYSGNTIAAQSQLFASGSFSFPWDSDAYGVSLSAGNQELELTLPQRGAGGSLASPSESDDQIFWGLHVPLNTLPGNYSGENTYTAVPD